MSNYQRYGDYIVNRKEALGMGKFGTVWRGYRIVHGREGQEQLQPVAIKESVYDQQNIQEVNTLQILNHPNIIHYIDYKISGHSLFLVMELCDGGTLEDLLMEFDEKENQTDQVLFYYSQIVRGIRFMYSKNILHRDIKPSNILIKNGKVKIADFGTSKMRKDNEMIRTLVGTPLFASPQILELFVGDEQSYTEKSDIWSLGLILYCMFHYQKRPQASLQRLKDSLPWKGKSAVEVLNNIRSQPLQFRCSTMPQEIRDIVTHMLTIDVEKRMSFKEFFEIKLFQSHSRSKRSGELSSMEQSTVQLELSVSEEEYVEYELTLINQCTHQPQYLQRETIDFQLLKLIEIRDCEDYQEKEVHDAIGFYEIIRDEAELADSKQCYNDFIFQIDCQIYQLLLLKRFFLVKIGHSQRGIRKSLNSERNSIVIDLLEGENEPLDEADLFLFRRCKAIRQKYFALSQRFEGVDHRLRQVFEELLDNSNIVEREKLMLKVIRPQEFLAPQTKLALRRLKPMFTESAQQIIAKLSRMELYLCYDLINVLAFDYCWRIRGQQKRKRTTKTKDFYDEYKEQRSKINICQIVSRIQQALASLIL